MSILDKVNQPQDLKKLSNEELEQLAQEIREFIIHSVSNTGGHLSSNLGIVELTLGIHRVLNSPKDKILFDIGHQSYTHKIITGRKDKFDTLRQPGGLSGFIKLDESEHDVWESAHAGNALAGAVAYALNNPENWVVCIVGDGTLTNGQLFEAFNNVGHLENLGNLIIILNDNNMSISPSVGGTTKMLDTLRNSRKINSIRHKFTMKYFMGLDNKLSNAIKRLGLNKPGSFFEAINIKYHGIFDGNDIEVVQKALRQTMKTKNNPKILHFSTAKGLGHEQAENDVVGYYHGVNKTSNEIAPIQEVSWSAAIADLVLEKMHQDETIDVITPAMLVGSKLTEIQKQYPKRTYDVGIAEPFALNFAAGLALNNRKPFVSIYSTFLQRAYDGVLHDCAINCLPVVIGIDRAGFSPGDGERNHGIYDISFLAPIPNVIISQPSNINEAQRIIDLAFESDRIFCIRYPRTNVGNIKTETLDFKIGQWNKITRGQKLTIITYGDNVEKVKEIAQEIKGLTIINALFLKPMDEKILHSLGKSNKKILIIEEATEINSLNSLITSFMAKNKYKNDIYVKAIDDHFYMHGSQTSLENATHLSKEDIIKTIKEIINE